MGVDGGQHALLASTEWQRFRAPASARILPAAHVDGLRDEAQQGEGDDHDDVAGEECHPGPFAEQEAAQGVGDQLAEEEDGLEAEEDGRPGSAG